MNKIALATMDERRQKQSCVCTVIEVLLLKEVIPPTFILTSLTIIHQFMLLLIYPVRVTENKHCETITMATKYSPSSSQAIAIDKAIAYYVANDMVSIHTVDKPGFHVWKTKSSLQHYFQEALYGHTDTTFLLLLIYGQGHLLCLS
jgi:hypothetical protein